MPKRPAKNRNTIRSEVIAATFTKAEKKRVAAAAKNDGGTMSGIVRKAVAAYLAGGAPT